MSVTTETAYFAAGCFWGIEEVFRRLEGVRSTVVGYQGGDVLYPTYEQVCTGQTGHAEVVAITYDRDQIDYDRLLSVFWQCHNPRSVNRQALDIGTQYRSAIFYVDEIQREKALKSRSAVKKPWFLSGPIVTEISRAKDFFPAEDYHQQYLEKNRLSSCKK